MTHDTPTRTGRHLAGYAYTPPTTRPARPIPIDRQLQIDLAVFNAGVVRARREYKWHPDNVCPPYHKCPNRLGVAS